MAVISCVVGFVVGVIAGLVGVGGGTLLVPIFTVCFGMAPVMATGTSLFTIVFTSLAGMGARLRNHTCNVKVGLLLGIGGALTSPLGSYAATQSPEIVVVVAVAAVIAYSAFTTLRKAFKQKPTAGDSGKGDDKGDKGKGENGGAGTPSALPEASVAANPQAANPPATGASTASAAAPAAPASPAACDAVVSAASTSSFPFAVKCLAIGLLTGAASGYVGLGGGFIMVPLMCNLLGTSMKEASGTSLLAIILIAASGSAAQFVYGNVDVLVGLFIACGSIPGAIVGGTLVSRVNDRTLRFIFAGFLFVAAIMLVARQTGVLG